MHAIFTLRIKPGASRPGLSHREGTYELRVRARAIDGKANLALIEDLAEILALAPRQLEILAGARSRIKRIKILGLTDEELEYRLTAATSATLDAAEKPLAARKHTL